MVVCENPVGKEFTRTNFSEMFWIQEQSGLKTMACYVGLNTADVCRYSVSDFSKQLLDLVWSQPLFDLSSVGKALWSKVKDLDRFRVSRFGRQ